MEQELLSGYPRCPLCNKYISIETGPWRIDEMKFLAHCPSCKGEAPCETGRTPFSACKKFLRKAKK